MNNQKLNKQQLANKIWAGANALRGKVSANEYKDYMLGLIFYKFLSEKEEKYLIENLGFSSTDINELKEDDADIVSNCQQNIGYFIESKNLFSTWIKNIQTNGGDKNTKFEIKSVRTALSAFNRLIGHNYKKVYDDIFDTLETGLSTLGSVDAERTKSLRNLITLIDEIPTSGSQDYDVLGFIYEFLLKNFAANAGKSGEFYTPYEASLVMSEIIAYHLKDKKEISIYDPTSGSGSLLINIGKSLSKHMTNPNKVKYYAQELMKPTYNLTRMNLIMRNVLPDNIIVRKGDTLADDWPFFDDANKEATYKPVFVDGCCSNPPYSQNWDNSSADLDVRFSEYGVSPKSKADYAFLLHNLYHLSNDGIMTIVLPHGVLFRGDNNLSEGEGSIRQKLIEKNNIEAIIGMPSNIFFGTGIPTIIMILKKKRDNSDVLFIDASNGYAKDGNKNKLRAKDIRKIVDTVINRTTIDKYSRLVSKKEIVENKYNLNIARYVDTFVPPESWDIYATMFGGIPKKEIDELSNFWNSFPTLRNQVFSQKEKTPYFNIKNLDVNKIVKENKDVINFLKKFQKSFEDFGSLLKKELMTNPLKVNAAQKEGEIAMLIKNNIKSFALIDYYDAYEILDNFWQKISLDIELIKVNGGKWHDTLRKVDPFIVEKKKTKKGTKEKEIVKVQKGWIGRIIPFDLIQDLFFANKKQENKQLSSQLELLNTNKIELLDSIDPNDKAELLKSDNETIDTKKLNKIIANLKKHLKSGAEYEEGSYEAIILEIHKINQKIKTLKKSLKSGKEWLEAKSKDKIENLTNEEAINVLYEKWISPLYKSINSLPFEIIYDLINKILKLHEKYSITFIETSKRIDDCKKQLSELLGGISGDEYDNKGIKQFRQLLHCEENNDN